MPAPLLQACLAAAVTLALYASYCHWEASRADLAANFRRMVPGLPGIRGAAFGGAGLRTRGRWAGLGALLLGLGCLASVL
jgi:hypothetical protein